MSVNFVEFFDALQVRIFFQLLLAIILGGALGLEREYHRKEAGLRTYALVTLGSALFTIVAFETFKALSGTPGVSFDPSRIIQAVAVGIGFIGAGIIIYRRFHVEGLTTAAGLWITGAIGVALGAQFYGAAILTTLLAIVVLAILQFVEQRIFQKEELPAEPEG